MFELHALCPWIEQKTKQVKDDTTITGYRDVIVKEIPHDTTFLCQRWTEEAINRARLEFAFCWDEPLRIWETQT